MKNCGTYTQWNTFVLKNKDWFYVLSWSDHRDLMLNEKNKMKKSMHHMLLFIFEKGGTKYTHTYTFNSHYFYYLCKLYSIKSP